MQNLKQAVAVLTGAGRVNGIGAATARQLAKAGCHIMLNYRNNTDEATQILAACQSYGVETDFFSRRSIRNHDLQKNGGTNREKMGKS